MVKLDKEESAAFIRNRLSKALFGLFSFFYILFEHMPSKDSEVPWVWWSVPAAICALVLCFFGALTLCFAAENGTLSS